MSSTLLWKDLFIARSSYWDQRRVFAFVAFQLCCKTMAENHILRPPWHTMKGISCPKYPGHNIQLLQFDQIQKKHFWTTWPMWLLLCLFYLLSMGKSVTYVKVLRVSQDFTCITWNCFIRSFFWEDFGRTDCEYLACFLLCFIVITGHYHLLLWWHQLVFMVRSSVFSCHQSWKS